jgi:hypothetical protein
MSLANIDLDAIEEFTFEPSPASGYGSFASDPSLALWGPPETDYSEDATPTPFDSDVDLNFSMARIDDDENEEDEAFDLDVTLDLDFLDADDPWETKEGEGLYSMSPWDILLSLFPDMDQERLSEVLTSTNYHLPSTFDILYERTSTAQATKKAICRYLLAGHCARSDCQFDHDLSSFMCRFFLSPTGCLKGDLCEFRHEGVADVRASRSKVAPETKPVANISSREEFPDLGGPKQKAASGSAPIPSSPFAYGQKEFSNATKRAPPAEVKDRAVPAKAKETTDSAPKRVVKVQDVSWKETGQAVSQLYSETRRLAFEQAAARNRFFQLAAELYRKGAKAEAARMASRGHELNEYVQALHNDAADKILRERDTGTLLELDAHGLHPQEAVYAVQDRLGQLSDRKIKGQLKVVVGTGNHSARGLQLSTAIETYLKGNRIRYAHGTLHDKKGGLLLITV